MTAPRKIGLFGGTFDPIHLGHLHLANLARESLGLDEVRFIPCRISPHKAGTHPTSAEQRLGMLRLATEGLPWAIVDDIELKSDQPNYSYQTAEQLHRRFPDDRLFWIMGGDQWARLPGWKHPEKLAGLVEFIVLARGDSPEPRPGYRMHRVHGSHPASATGIRSGKSPHHLSPPVAEWIARNRLYHPPSH